MVGHISYLGYTVRLIKNEWTPVVAGRVYHGFGLRDRNAAIKLAETLARDRAEATGQRVRFIN